MSTRDTLEEFSSQGLNAALLDLLDQAITLDHAAKGTLQLFSPDSGALHIVAQRGFDLPFLQLFERVRADDTCACSRAFRLRRRIVVTDVMEDPGFTPYLSIVTANGYRAVQATPILGKKDRMLGVCSTHFAEPHKLSKSAQAGLDGYASKMARLIEQWEE